MITTLKQVRNVLPNVSQKDETIIEMIQLVEDWIKGYCQDDYAEGYPPGYELIAIKMIEFNLNQKAGYASESLSRHSVSFLEDYPKSITKGLRRRLSW
jgi:hypothetical protein